MVGFLSFDCLNKYKEECFIFLVFDPLFPNQTLSRQNRLISSAGQQIGASLPVTAWCLSNAFGLDILDGFLKFSVHKKVVKLLSVNYPYAIIFVHIVGSMKTVFIFHRLLMIIAKLPLRQKKKDTLFYLELHANCFSLSALVFSICLGRRTFHGIIQSWK